jgi:hypothetical protein
MSRKIILLNLALLALAGTLVWQARLHYLETKAHEREILRRAAHPRPVLAPPAVPQPQPVQSMQYLDVAQRTLFSRDRNPTVVIEPPPPKPEPPMPALPTYYGQINLGDPVIFLSVGGGAQKRFQVGDKVGDFKLLSFNQDTVTLGWADTKQVEKKLNEIKAKVDQPSAAAQPFTGVYQAPAPPGAPSSSGGAQIKSLSGPLSNDSVKPDSAVGADRGDGFRGCVMTDTTPAGTVVDGYRKVVTTTLMGKSCYWEKAK